MTTINLKEFFYWYTTDKFIEVSDEVAEELRADKRYEATHPATKHSIRWTLGTVLKT